MPRRDTDEQINITLSVEEKTKIKESADRRGMSVNAFMKQAAQEFVLEEYGRTLSDKKSQIDRFLTHINIVIDSYKTALDDSIHAEEIARDKVREQLNGMQALVDEVNELRKDQSSKEKELAEKDVAIEALTAERNDSNTLYESEKKKHLDLIEEHKTLCTNYYKSKEVEHQMKEEVLSLKEEIAELKEIHDEEVLSLKREIVELKEEHAEEMESLRSKYMSGMISIASGGRPPVEKKIILPWSS